MSYSIPIEFRTLPPGTYYLENFIKKLKLKNDTMVFLSENCYSWLKANSTCMEQPTAKVFMQHDTKDNSKAFIETINVDSSNCSFLKSFLSSTYHYEYTNGIPKKILILLLDNEKNNFHYDIFVSVLEPDKNESPVECIIDQPALFENSIVFLNSTSYKRLKRNSNTISNIYNFERLIWEPDERYPGGDIMLNCLNLGNLYVICNMSFSFFTKNFSFSSSPKAIYFIS